MSLVVVIALPASVVTADNAPLVLIPKPIPIPAAQAKSPTHFNRYLALSDPDHRISKLFRIPPSLRLRTRFWFDIYTRYGSHDFVIHDAMYPWIIFRVVHTSYIFKGHLNKWAKYAKEKRVVWANFYQVRRALFHLSKIRNYAHLTHLERLLVFDLSHVRGPRQFVYRQAAENMRIQLGQKDFFSSGLKVCDRYLPFMEKEFAANGLPVELTRLPFVESSFNIHAESKVGASGIWQIMPGMGREFLIVNDRIDERNSPFKSSLVAIKLLKQNYHKFRSWPLAITAYNFGWHGLLQAIKKVHSRNLAVLIARYHGGAFKFASENFYASFLAALHAEEYHKEIFKNVPTAVPPENFKVVALQEISRPKTLMKRLGISKKELLTYDFDLKWAVRYNSIIPKGYDLILPSQQNSDPLEKKLLDWGSVFRDAQLRVTMRTPAG